MWGKADRTTVENNQLTNTVGFSTPSIIVKTCRQKISKYLEDLKNTINHLDLIDLDRALHPISALHTLFSCAFRAFPMETIFWDAKQVIINKGFKPYESMFSGKRRRKFEINNISGKSPNIWKLNNILLIKKSNNKLEIYWPEWKWKHNTLKFIRYRLDNPRGKFITIVAYIKIEENSQINDFTFHLKKPEKSKLNPK